MLINHTNDPTIALLVDQTRRAENSGPQLAALHRNVGRALARDVGRGLELELCDITHPTGLPSVGWRLKRQPRIYAMMRAGLFLAEGIWEMIPEAKLILLHGSESIHETDTEHPIIIVDSVINSGKSVRALLGQFAQHENITIVTLVGYEETMAALEGEFPNVSFVAARVSVRTYVGRGSTDTGARLFGTTDLE